MNNLSLLAIGAVAVWLCGATADAQDHYRVVKGDTLYGISKRYGISLKQLMQANSLRGSLIHPGQTLMIPGYQPTASYQQNYRTKETSTHVDYTPYEPYAGTSSSASSYTPATTKASTYRNRDSYLPSTSTSATYRPRDPQFLLHTVRHGDSLWSIAQRYGLTVNSIKQRNGLSCDHIHCGQQLYIPVVTASSGDTCTSANCQFNPTSYSARKTQSYGY